MLVLLFFAIYGLSGIYHSAEELLEHKGIVKKFLVYKIFTLLAKLQRTILGTVVHHDIIDSENFKYNEFWSAGLRVDNIIDFAECVEAMIAFPLALKFYSTSDYKVEDANELHLHDETVKNEVTEKKSENV